MKARAVITRELFKLQSLAFERTPAAVYWLAGAGALLLWMLTWPGFGEQKRSLPVTAEGEASCWILIDFDKFFCTPCLNPLMDFCRAIPTPLQKEKVRGILVFSRSPQSQQAEQYTRIIRKKMKAFVKANDIQFPLVLDEAQIFSGLAKTSIVALIFDYQGQVVRKYDLPFKQGQLAELTKILLR